MYIRSNNTSLDAVELPKIISYHFCFPMKSNNGGSGSYVESTSIFVSVKLVYIDIWSCFEGENNPRNGFLVHNGCKNTSVDVIEICIVVSEHL